MVATSKRVLVVDDEDVVCRSYERVLTQVGFDVSTAHSGAEALEKVRARDYDVMLADLRMPGMDGLKVIEKVRETHPGLPVVVITGFPSQDTLQAAARLGVSDYLTKPILPDVLTHAAVEAVTAPPMSSPPRYLAPEPQENAPKPVEATFPEKVAHETLFWPPEAQVAPTKPLVEEPAVPTEVPEPGKLRVAMHLAAAPVISIAYVMFLPFLGFALFFGLGAKALAKKFSREEV